MSKPIANRRSGLSDAAGMVLFVVFLPLIFGVLAFYLFVGLLLQIAAWCWWCSRGRDVLFVYSDSPVWHDYVVNRILPQLENRAIVLNWSHRRRWHSTLSTVVFRYFGGSREFNPLAVVFRPFRPARRFRFYEPFQELKHGNPAAVARLEQSLYQYLRNDE